MPPINSIHDEINTAGFKMKEGNLKVDEYGFVKAFTTFGILTLKILSYP